MLRVDMAEDLKDERVRIDSRIQALMTSPDLLDDVISAAHEHDMTAAAHPRTWPK